MIKPSTEKDFEKYNSKYHRKHFEGENLTKADNCPKSKPIEKYRKIFKL